MKRGLRMLLCYLVFFMVWINMHHIPFSPFHPILDKFIDFVFFNFLFLFYFVFLFYVFNINMSIVSFLFNLSVFYFKFKTFLFQIKKHLCDILIFKYKSFYFLLYFFGGRSPFYIYYLLGSYCNENYALDKNSIYCNGEIKLSSGENSFFVLVLNLSFYCFFSLCCFKLYFFFIILNFDFFLL